MKTILAVIILSASFTYAYADEYVHGYTRGDGTYVEPYHRSSPNDTTSDNWSTKGNYNPYTGKEGTRSY